MKELEKYYTCLEMIVNYDISFHLKIKLVWYDECLQNKVTLIQSLQ
jgi:hypothetical protein